MARTLITLSDEEVERCYQFQRQYGCRLSPYMVRMLSGFMEAHRVMTVGRIADLLWPDDDGLEGAEFGRRANQHVCFLRKRLGKLAEIDTVRGAGYVLQRLGPEDNPIFERK